MNQLLIIGARGLGREIFDMLPNCLGYGNEYEVKGFLDDNRDALVGFEGYPSIVDSVENYVIQENDIFICALGDVKYKKKYCDIIKNKGGNFYTLIHKTADISNKAVIGDGCFVDKFAIIGSNSKIGNNVLVQPFAIIGHDCVVGDYARIDTHCTCVGGTKIGRGATIYTNSVINHNVIVGEDASVGACSFVIRNVKKGTTVCGNPAKVLIY